MIAELFTNNALNLVIIFGSCAALILMSFWFRRGKVFYSMRCNF